ncbi:hypothetical protein [Paraburkholderia fungorum]|uniref:hypothetical protein n=1 Tax=Paraburkholderia fungorum TaxID=134537 RepID=UPI0038BCF4E6
MTAPVTPQPTKKAFHFPTSPTGQEKESAEPAVAPEQLVETASVVKKATKVKRPASAETAPAVKKAAKAKASAAAETAPAAKKTAKLKRSAVAKTPSTVEKAAKPKRPASAQAAPAVKKEARPKRAAASNAAPASVAEAKKAKPPKKEKVVRDSFTMPKSDYDRIASLKQKCLDAGVSVKKSELLRAGLMMLESAAPQRLLAAVSSLETVKTGRPAKD